MMGHTRSWWGWGYEEEALSPDEQEAVASGVAALLALDGLEGHDPPAVGELDLRAPRVTAPPDLGTILSADPRDRAAHAHGKATRDIVRNLLGRLDHPPDLVAHPADEQQLVRVLEWCAKERLATIPYGGGSSVVGGVEARVGDGYRGAISVDLGAMDAVLEIDEHSRAARIQGGALGPGIEDALRPRGLTLRHFPQSFEFSTLGGWIATRSGGHFATVYTHIDDLVESTRMVTPSGVVESRRLPASGAGPSPDRLVMGSEGALGVITEAWVRLQPRPRWRASASVEFKSFTSAAEAVRAISQSGLFPANCRLLDGGEALIGAGIGGVESLLVLGFESGDHPLEPWMGRALEICADHQGTPREPPRYSEREAQQDPAAGAWRNAFMRAPYVRDALLRRGIVMDTFETACTWDRFADFHAALMERARTVATEVCGNAFVTCRFTHVYPDGPAPYYTVIAPGRWGDQVRQWDEIKAAVSEVISTSGGTITHHHAVGRDHMPWYERERPVLFGEALRAAKRAFDPAGIMNPGVIVGAGSP